VLVDERRPCAGMSHSGHQLLGTCPGRRRQGVSGVSQVMEVQMIETHFVGLSARSD